MEKYIEVGVTSARDPITREFLPAVPMYIKSTPEAEESEAALIKDLGKLFGRRMRQYIEEGGLMPAAE